LVIALIKDEKSLSAALCELLYDEDEPNYLIGEVIEQISFRNRKSDSLIVLSVNNQLGFIEQTEQFENRMVASQDTSNYKIVSLDDFAYNPARINVGSIARLKRAKKGIVSPMYVCFRCKQIVLPDYLESFFDTDYFYLEMKKRLEGSVRMCLPFEGLCNIPIQIPDLQQQKRVGRKIQLLMEKIKLEESVYKQLSIQKQILLSQLFI
jgi:type I restriction enzyme S subunit